MEDTLAKFKVGDRVWVQTDPWSDDNRSGYAVVTRVHPESFTEVQFEPELVSTDRLKTASARPMID
jgi:hypothetical protein